MWKSKKAKEPSASGAEIKDFSKFRWSKKYTKVLLVGLIILLVVLAALYYATQSNNSTEQSSDSADPRRTACIQSLKESGSFEELVSATVDNQVTIERKSEVIEEIKRVDYEKDFNCLYILAALNLQVSQLSEASSYLGMLKNEIIESDSFEPGVYLLAGSVEDLELAISYAENQSSETVENTFFCCSDDTERVEPGEDD